MTSPILLDTHVLVDFSAGRPRIGRRSRRLIDRALNDSAVTYSVVSIWEIGLLVDNGRIRLDTELHRWREAALRQGFAETPLSGSMVVRGLEVLPGHPDLFDRMIVASALSKDAVLLTADGTLLGWPSELRRQDSRD